MPSSLNGKGGDGLNYLENSISDDMLRGMLERAYGSFKLFHKSFNHILSTLRATKNEAVTLTNLKITIDEFFSGYSTRFQSVDFDILNLFKGIHYLTLSAPHSQILISFLQSIESKYPFIKSSFILFKHHLVTTTTIPKTQSSSNSPIFQGIKQIYDYITDPETGKFADSLIAMVKDKDVPVISSLPKNLNAVREPMITLEKSSKNGLFGIIKNKSKKNEKFSGFLVPETPESQNIVERKRLYLGELGIEVWVIIYQ
ncbi:hypothetical protein HK096_003121, partial [Nowakowskiella sp. JEL0078]